MKKRTKFYFEIVVVYTNEDRMFIPYVVYDSSFVNAEKKAHQLCVQLLLDPTVGEVRADLCSSNFFLSRFGRL